MELNSNGDQIQSYQRYVIRNPTSNFDERTISSQKEDKNCHPQFRLSVVDSPGYGNKTDLKDWRQMILDELR